MLVVHLCFVFVGFVVKLLIFATPLSAALINEGVHSYFYNIVVDSVYCR